jgi:hypothetical protein
MLVQLGLLDASTRPTGHIVAAIVSLRCVSQQLFWPLEEVCVSHPLASGEPSDSTPRLAAMAAVVLGSVQLAAPKGRRERCLIGQSDGHASC